MIEKLPEKIGLIYLHIYVALMGRAFSYRALDNTW